MYYSGTYKCSDCGNVETYLFRIKVIKKRNYEMPERVRCLECRAMMEYSPHAPSVRIEENNDPVSTKQGSYWRNAERIRQQKEKKRFEIEAEKKRYGGS